MEIFDDIGGSLLSIKGFHYAKLRSDAKSEAAMYASKWIELPRGKLKNTIHGTNYVAVVQLSGCHPFSSSLLEEMGVLRLAAVPPRVLPRSRAGPREARTLESVPIGIRRTSWRTPL